MKSWSLVVPTRFLQAVIALAGVGALALMLWEPQIEGRNANATFFEIYFKDAFLAYAYLASIPFFVALVQAIKVLRFIGQGMAFSPAATRALRTITKCALTLIGLVAVGILFIFLGDSDDRAGGVFVGSLIAFGSVIVAAAATMFERILQSAVSFDASFNLQRTTMIKVSVMYPNKPGVRFDHAYYRDKHMPLVKARMGDNCRFYTVDKGLAGGGPGDPPTYIAMCHIFCDSVEAFQAGMGPHLQEIRADIPNYTDQTPVLQVSEVVVGQP